MRWIPCIALLFAAGTAPAQDFALDRLNDSPRHHEWLEIPAPGNRTIHAFAAYPESDADARAVLVIHENRGLTDWVRSFADRLAGAGYVAVAPDLLSGFDDARNRTADFADSDAARSAIYELDGSQVMSDLQAVLDHMAGMPGVSGKPVVAGFCWGGSRSFQLATNTDDIAAALVFYGTAPDEADAIGRISAPVFGFYGADDQRVNATIPGTEDLMQSHGKRYEYRIYDGAGHAFMRQGADPEADPAAREAREQAWQRVLDVIAGLE